MIEKAEAAPLSVEEANQILANATFLESIVSGIFMSEDLNSDGKISQEEFNTQYEKYDAVKDEL